jgi:hypothetical protein
MREQHLPVVAKSTRPPIDSTGIGEIHADLGLSGTVVAERLEPARQLRGPPACIHHEIRSQHAGACIVSQQRSKLHAADRLAAAIGTQSHDLRALQNADVVESSHLLTQVPFECIRRLKLRRESAARAGAHDAQMLPVHLRAKVDCDRAVRSHRAEEVGEQLLQNGLTLVGKQVGVLALRRPRARSRRVGQCVTLHQRDADEVFRQHACRQQARDACADHDGMTS